VEMSRWTFCVNRDRPSSGKCAPGGVDGTGVALNFRSSTGIANYSSRERSDEEVRNGIREAGEKRGQS